MSLIIPLIEQFIQDKQLGHASVDRDFSTLQETSNRDLENRVLSAKKGKGLQLQREHQSSEIVILLDINCNVREHFEKNKQDNLIREIIDYFSSDYIISIQTVDHDITSDWHEYLTDYPHTDYKSSIHRIVKKAKEFFNDGVIPIVVSDFLDYSGDLDDAVCIQITLPIVSLHYHDYYVDNKLSLQTNYLYEG